MLAGAHCAIYDPCSLSRCRHRARRRRRRRRCRRHDSWCRNLSLPVSSLSSIDDSRGPLITTIGDLSTTPRRVVRRSTRFPDRWTRFGTGISTSTSDRFYPVPTAFPPWPPSA